MKTPTFNLPEIPAEEQTPSVWQMLQIILQLQEHIKQLENEISHLKKHQRDEVRSSATDLKVPPTQPLKETTPTVAETITTPPVAETIKKVLVRQGGLSVGYPSSVNRFSPFSKKRPLFLLLGY